MTRPTIMTGDAEAQAVRDKVRQEAEANRDPMECPPIVGEDGSLTWEIFEEVEHGMRVKRRRRLDD